MADLINVTEAARLLGMTTASGQPSRNALYRHINAHGPEINGIMFAVRINGHWRCLPEAIARINRGEHGETEQTAA